MAPGAGFCFEKGCVIDDTFVITVDVVCYGTCCIALSDGPRASINQLTVGNLGSGKERWITHGDLEL